jgi:hypothetical protein
VTLTVPNLLDDRVARLDQAERRIESAKATIEQAFAVIGRELREIRDAGLYKVGYTTFEAYLAERWGFSRSRAYRLIDAAVVAEAVSPIGDIPNERQARELAPLLRDDGERAVAEVWRDLHTKNGNGVTAAKVRSAVRERAEPPPVPASGPPTIEDVLGAVRELQRLLRAYVASDGRP